MFFFFLKIDFRGGQVGAIMTEHVENALLDLAKRAAAFDMDD